MNPSMSHLTSKDYKQIYEPSDDTWLFVDALESEKNVLKDCRICLEIGSGSGYVSAYLNKLVNSDNHKCFFFAVDINENAAVATTNTFKHNNSFPFCDVVLTSFGDALCSRLHNSIDVLLFNPPYVPSEDDELGFNNIVASYAGGECGRQVIDQFLPRVKNLLSNDGIFYLILIQENKPEEVIDIMSRPEYGGFNGQIIRKKKVLGEILFVTKFTKIKSNN
ncbi:HemK methyltransferase [Acrasis kona]|uniref:HemK methyltransferase n=1 Tax=Acrasis kona TaxID=1008807 RepID=A0AAW2Z2D3_9EUKA